MSQTSVWCQIPPNRSLLFRWLMLEEGWDLNISRPCKVLELLSLQLEDQNIHHTTGMVNDCVCVCVSCYSKVPVAGTCLGGFCSLLLLVIAECHAAFSNNRKADVLCLVFGVNIKATVEKGLCCCCCCCCGCCQISKSMPKGCG